MFLTFKSSLVIFASSAFSFSSFSFFSIFIFCRRKHLFQVCPSDFPGLWFFYQVQVFEEEEEEELLEFPDFVGFCPFFLLPVGLETKRAELSSISEVSISISRCFTSAYDELSFVVRLSITFLWCLTKKPNRKSLLAISSLRNVAKVFQYE